MEKFYFEPLWTNPGLSGFYRQYRESERVESFEMYCLVEPDRLFDDVHHLAEARFNIDAKEVRLYVSPFQHLLEYLDCTYEADCEKTSEVYLMCEGVYARVVQMDRVPPASQSMSQPAPQPGRSSIKKMNLG